jgi:hypothetical protein
MSNWTLGNQPLRYRAGQVPAAAASAVGTFYAVAGPLSAGLSAYHGYRRDGTVVSALLWALAGGTLPIIVPAIALAQGLGKSTGKRWP